MATETTDIRPLKVGMNAFTRLINGLPLDGPGRVT
jgi:hypothetical protein